MSRFNRLQVGWNKKSQHLCVCACFVSSSWRFPLPGGISLVWPEEAVSLWRAWSRLQCLVTLDCAYLAENWGIWSQNCTVWLRYTSSDKKPHPGAVSIAALSGGDPAEKSGLGLREQTRRLWEAGGWSWCGSWWLSTVSRCWGRHLREGSAAFCHRLGGCRAAVSSEQWRYSWLHKVTALYASTAGGFLCLFILHLSQMPKYQEKVASSIFSELEGEHSGSWHLGRGSQSPYVRFRETVHINFKWKS